MHIDPIQRTHVMDNDMDTVDNDQWQYQKPNLDDILGIEKSHWPKLGLHWVYHNDILIYIRLNHLDSK